MKKVSIYTTPSCVYCKMAKDYFSKHKVQYTELDVASDAKARDLMIQKTGQLGVPVIDIDGKYVVGFDQRRLAELLEISG